MLRCAGGSKARLKKCQIFFRMCGSLMKPTSLYHVSSKNSVCWGAQAPVEALQRPRHSAKCTAWVAISKHGIIGPFWFENDVGETVTVHKKSYIVVLLSSGGHFVPVVVCGERSNCSNKTVQLPIQLTSLWSGWIVALQVDWSADVAFQKGHRIHHI